MNIAALQHMARMFTGVILPGHTLGAIQQHNDMHRRTLGMALHAGLQPTQAHLITVSIPNDVGVGFLFQEATDGLNQAQLLLIGRSHQPEALRFQNPIPQELHRISLMSYLSGQDEAPPIHQYAALAHLTPMLQAAIGEADIEALQAQLFDYALMPKRPLGVVPSIEMTPGPALEIFDTLIDHIQFHEQKGLNTRIRHALTAQGIHFVGQLVRLSPSALPGGQQTRQAILNYLQAHDLSLGMDNRNWQKPGRHHRGLMQTPLTSLSFTYVGGMNQALQRHLVNAGAVTLEDVLHLKKTDLLNRPYFNIGHYDTIRNFLRSLGLDFDK